MSPSLIHITRNGGAFLHITCRHTYRAVFMLPATLWSICWFCSLDWAVVVTDVRSTTTPCNYSCLTDSFPVDLGLFAHAQLQLPWLYVECLLFDLPKEEDMRAGRRCRVNPGISNDDVASYFLTELEALKLCNVKHLLYRNFHANFNILRWHQVALKVIWRIS